MGVTIELDGNVTGLLVVGLGQEGDMPMRAVCYSLVELAHGMVEQMRKPVSGLIPAEDRLRIMEQAAEMERAAEALRDALAEVQLDEPTVWAVAVSGCGEEPGSVRILDQPAG